jgi:TonB family protein
LLNSKIEQVILTPATENAGAIQPEAGPVKPAVANVTNKPAEKATVTIDIVQPAVADTTKKDSRVFTSVEHVPDFPGGFKAFLAFLSNNIKYPAAMRNNNVQGRVIISFIVEADGTLTDIRVVRSLEQDADAEAVRVIKLSPKWNPGSQNGHLVRVQYTVPINFSLAKATEPEGEKTGYVGDGQVHKVALGAMSVIVSKTDTGQSVLEINQKDPAHAPIYVLDGKVVSDLMTVNPENIASISILKDKASTVLYGPKAVNGVVVITTKGNKLNLRLTEPVKEKQ